MVKNKKNKNTQTPLLLEMDLSTRMGYESPLGINGFKLSLKVTSFCSYSIFAVVERFHCILHEKYCVDTGLHMLVNITKACLYNIEPLKPLFIWWNWGLQGYTLFSLFLLKNIGCGYLLELPRRGGSNEYPQSVFWAEIWKNIRVFIWKFSVFGGEIIYIFE